MSASDERAQVAWQPLTPRGVAAFAQAPLGRLLLVQLIVALLAAGTVVWFLHQCWFPTIAEAIRALPAQGEIRAGRLDWTVPAPARLAQSRFLSIAADLEHTGEALSPAHVQLEFGQTNLKVYSLLGSFERAYPHSGVWAFNRTELLPWWGAWAPAILAITAGAVVTGLFVVWAALATLYCLPVWLIAFFADRDCGLGRSWRLAGAALMPGALLMCVAIYMYGCAALDPLSLAVTAGVHVLAGWVYLSVSLLCLPRRTAVMAKANPFA